MANMPGARGLSLLQLSYSRLLSRCTTPPETNVFLLGFVYEQRICIILLSFSRKYMYLMTNDEYVDGFSPVMQLPVSGAS